MIDASIPLQVRPVQVENPLNTYARALELHNLQRQSEAQPALLAQQQAMNEEHLKGQRLANEAAQRQADLVKHVGTFWQKLLGQEDPEAAPGAPTAAPAATPAPAATLAAAPVIPARAGEVNRLAPSFVERTSGEYQNLDKLTPTEQAQAVWNLPQKTTLFTPGAEEPLLPANAGNAPPAPRAPQQPQATSLLTHKPDFTSALRSLAAAGGGAAIPGLLKEHSEQLTKAAILQKDLYENMQRQAEGLASILQPVKDARPEDKEAMYQRALPLVRSFAQKFGLESALQIPANYDPQAVNMISSLGVKAADQARIAKEGADTLRLVTEQNIKNADDFTKRYRNDLSTITSPQDLEVKNHKFEALAKALDPSGALSNTFQQIREDNFTPDLAKRMNSLTMTGEQRATLPFTQRRVEAQETRNQIAQQNANTNAQRLKNETSLQHKEKIRELAQKAIDESKANGGPTIDDAIRNVQEFYKAPHPIGLNRTDVLDELQRRKLQGPGGLNEQVKQGQADRAKQDQQMVEILMGKKPATAPATPPAQPRPPPPPAP